MRLSIVAILYVLPSVAYFPAMAAGREGVRVRPAAILRSKGGSVQVRCSHTPGKDWRGVLLHSGDAVEVRRGGWASVSLEASGARYLLASGSSVRIENGRLIRLSGPVPRRGYDTPRLEPVNTANSPKSSTEGGEAGAAKSAKEPDRD